MAVKLAFVIVAMFLFCQMITWGTASPRVAREVAANAASDSSKSIDEALQSFKTGIDDLLKNIQSNELFQNISSSVQQFGENVQQQTKQLVEKIQTDGGKHN